MADKQITDLTPITTPSDADKLLIRHGGVDCNIDYSELAKAILDKLRTQEYADLGTTAKTVPAALNELNSKTHIPQIYYSSGTEDTALDLLDNPTKLFGDKTSVYNILFHDATGNSPFGGGISCVYGYTYPNDDFGVQSAIRYGNNSIFIRNKYNSTWSEWRVI